MKLINRIALGAATLLLAAAVVWALRPQPVLVELSHITQGVFEQTVSDDGRTRVLERYTVSAPLAGRLERIRLKVGDTVARGQVVALLAPAAPAFVDARTARELQERIGAASAQVMRMQAESSRVSAQRDQANADFARQSRLLKDGFISAAALEQAKLSLHTSEKSLEAARFAEDAARHELNQARAALTRYRGGGTADKWQVTSPVQGSVLKVIEGSEGVVALGAALIELANPRSLEAVVDVLSQESVTIRPGMPARIELGGGMAPLGARVRLVEPAAFTKVSALGVEEQRVNVVLDFTEPLDKIQTIGDGFRVEATIVTSRIENAIKVPVGALFRDGEAWAVFAVENGRAVKRVLTATQRNSTEAMVQGGVGVGDQVVVYPSDTLRDGSRIRTR